MTEKAKKRVTKRKTVSMAEMKRQVANLKLELSQQTELIDTQGEMIEELKSVPTQDLEYEAPPLLGERWTMVLGVVEVGLPIAFLDGDDELDSSAVITKIDQGDDIILFQVECGLKNGYFGDLDDAGEQGERWADAPANDPKRLYAKNNPTVIRNRFESEDHTIGQDVPRVMKSTGPARDSLEPAYIQPVDRPISKAKMEMLAFMEEEIQVMVHDTTDDQAVPIPCFYNDGIPQHFIRGKSQTVKRKFVEIIARCKKTGFTQVLEQDCTGADTYVNYPHTALVYPFSVVTDPHPKGADWLAAILNEG